MNTALDNARQDLAQQLGEDVGRITVRQPEWARLMKEGVVCEVHIGRWRANHRLTLEDLGLRIEDEGERRFWQEFLTLGEKRLLPARYLKALASIDASARGCLEAHSFGTGWGRFVPVTAYATWKERNEQYRQQYLALGREIVERYPELVEQVLAGYRAGARGAYERLLALGATPDVGPREFAERFVDRISALIPSRQEVEASFYYDTALSYIPLPSVLEQDLAERDEIRRRREVEEERYQRERDRDWALRKVENQALAERERQLAEMNRDILANFRRQKEEQVDGFLRNLVAQLRGTVYEVVVSALESIQRNDGRLVGKAAESLRNLIATVQKLNFYGDRELSAKIEQIQGLLGPAPEERSVEAIQQGLQELGLLCRAALIDLGERPRSGRDVGIADVVPVGTVRLQRAALGLDPDVSALQALRGRRTWET